MIREEYVSERWGAVGVGGGEIVPCSRTLTGVIVFYVKQIIIGCYRPVTSVGHIRPTLTNNYVFVCLFIFLSFFLTFRLFISFLFFFFSLSFLLSHGINVSLKSQHLTCLSVFLPHSLPPLHPLVYMNAHKRNVIMMFLHICRNCETAINQLHYRAYNICLCIVVFICVCSIARTGCQRGSV